MIIVGNVEFFKVIVIKIDLFESQIVDERHFKTREEAETFKQQATDDLKDTVCVICRM